MNKKILISNDHKVTIVLQGVGSKGAKGTDSSRAPDQGGGEEEEDSPIVWAMLTRVKTEGVEARWLGGANAIAFDAAETAIMTSASARRRGGAIIGKVGVFFERWMELRTLCYRAVG